MSGIKTQMKETTWDLYLFMVPPAFVHDANAAAGVVVVCTVTLRCISWQIWEILLQSWGGLTSSLLSWSRP